MQSEIIQQGVSLLIYGMGTVFVFLTLLVFATKAMSAMVQRLTPLETDADSTANKDNTDVNEDIRSAIQQAIALYRQQH